MKKLVTLLLILLSFSTFSQFNSGFDATEVRNMIQICNSFGYIDLYSSDKEILPAGFEKEFTSASLGMDNKFQVYKSGDKGVINFRGTTSKQTSWMENLYASMIPAKGKIIINGKKFNYQMGENSGSYIHAGYTLAIGYMKDDLLNQIRELNKQGIYDIYITGHSQGGALAILFRSYLNYLPESELSKKNNFKVYAFANPMVGNDSYVKEYNNNYCDNGMSFAIHNPEDFVIKLPVSQADETFWEKNISLLLSNSKQFSKSNALMEGAMYMFKDKVVELAKTMSKQIEAMLFKELGTIEMPEFQSELNYKHTGNIILISPTTYPLELKDSTILQNDSIMRVSKRDENGIFVNKDLYKQTSPFLQHKPYNYYTAILKDYFQNDYAILSQKYFVMPSK